MQVPPDIDELVLHILLREIWRRSAKRSWFDAEHFDLQQRQRWDRYPAARADQLVRLANHHQLLHGPPKGMFADKFGEWRC